MHMLGFGFDDADLCYLNFGKSFHVVNYRIFCAKLTALGFADPLVDWVKRVLSNRTIKVNIGQVVSDEDPIREKDHKWIGFCNWTST